MRLWRPLSCGTAILTAYSHVAGAITLDITSESSYLLALITPCELTTIQVR